MTNTDKVVDYILAQAGKLQPDKIKALAEVVRALGGEVSKDPNTLPLTNDNDLLKDDEPIDLKQIESVEIEGVGKQDIHLYQ